MIRQASIYDLGGGPEVDGLRVLVMRRWPRGIRKDRIGLWMKDAAPSGELLHAYNHEGLPWDEFSIRYRLEMEQRQDVLARLSALEREHGTITLLCHERHPKQHCHRLILLELLGGRHTGGLAS